MGKTTSPPAHFLEICHRGLESVSHTETAIYNLLQAVCLQYEAFNNNKVNVCPISKNNKTRCNLVLLLKSMIKIQKILLKKTAVYYSQLVYQDLPRNTALRNQMITCSKARDLIAKTIRNPPCKHNHWLEIYPLLHKLANYYEKKNMLFNSIAIVESKTPAPPYFPVRSFK